MRKFACLLIILFLFGCGGAEKKPEMVKVEFRLAETEPAEDLTEMTIPGLEEKFYLHNEVLLSNDDIQFAFPGSLGDRAVIELTLTEAGKEKFAQITKENLEKRIGILIDGKLVMAPTIKAPILEGKAVIDGNFSEEEAERLATSIMLK
ncbi:MAG: hypothetical protein WBD28_04385 [Candidatus Zixiibacteriota bacterium]